VKGARDVEQQEGVTGRCGVHNDVLGSAESKEPAE
jgi:hypothetical protein